MNAIINWPGYDTAFGDSDDEDLNDAADPGEIMEGGEGEVPNEAGTYSMSYPLHVSYLSHLYPLILLTEPIQSKRCSIQDNAYYE